MGSLVAERATSPNIGAVIGGRYVIERRLGEGGMGTVYLARHNVTGRRVALKWVLTEDVLLRQRFVREARSMGRLSHPNVVGVLDAGEHHGAVYSVMEYVEGEDLHVHARSKQLSYHAAIDLIMPVMGGIAAAHQAGILHRDLKPENLFVCLDSDGTAFDTKVLDFGVAKRMGDRETSLTGSGMIVGTPKYMAPEQFTDGDNLDARMDIYAIGLILYELLSGELPFRSTSLKTLAVEILSGKLSHLSERAPGLPRELCDVIMKAVATERADRYPDIASFARALEPYAGARRFEPPRKAHTPRLSYDDVGALAKLTNVSPKQEQPHTQAQPEAETTAIAPAAHPVTSSPAAPQGRAHSWYAFGAVALVLLALAVGWSMQRTSAQHTRKQTLSRPAPSLPTVASPAEHASLPAEPLPQPTLPIAPTLPSDTSAADAAPPRGELKPVTPAPEMRRRERKSRVTVTTTEAVNAPAQAVKVRGGTLRVKDF